MSGAMPVLMNAGQKSFFAMSSATFISSHSANQIPADDLEVMIRNWYYGRALQHASTATKDAIRDAHLAHRMTRALTAMGLLEHGRNLLPWFAEGSEIRPSDIEPAIIPIRSETEHARLFRLASLWWSVPVSHGFGRRQRFLVIDKSNSKLIGIFALGDPVFNLGPRDRTIGWTARDRELRLRYVVDAFVLGAVPPYSSLLCGKLVAALTTAAETEKAFCSVYQGRRTFIRNKRENASLALLTTSAVFGRSSVYARLTVNSRLRFQFVGVTKGYGHFHVPPDVFAAMVHLLETKKHPYAHGNRFGNGPNWKIRVIRVALKILDLDVNWLNHGFPRGVYIAPLAENYQKFLQGKERHLCKGSQSSVEAIADAIKARWIVPRSHRREDWKETSGPSVMNEIFRSISGTEKF